MLVRMWRKGTSLTRWECKLVQPLWKTVWRFLKKLKIELLYDPAIALIGINPKEYKNHTKTTIGYHLTPVRMGKNQHTRNNSCWRECGERETILHCWWECKLVQPLWKTVWRFLKKLKIELHYNPAIALLGIYPKGYKHCDLKEHVHPDVYSSNVHNSQTTERAQMFINR